MRTRMMIIIMREEKTWKTLQIPFLHLQPIKKRLLQWIKALHLKNLLSQHPKKQSQKVLLRKQVKQSQKETKIRRKKRTKKKIFHLRRFLRVPKKEIIEKMTEAVNEKVVEIVEREVGIDEVIVEIGIIIETEILGETGLDIEMVLWTGMEIRKKEVEVEGEGTEIRIRKLNLKEKKWSATT